MPTCGAKPSHTTPTKKYEQRAPILLLLSHVWIDFDVVGESASRSEHHQGPERSEDVTETSPTEESSRAGDDRNLLDLPAEHHFRTTAARGKPTKQGKRFRLFSDAYQFLSYLPESLGGVYPVAVALFHTDDNVRLQAARLLQQMDKIKV